MGTGPPGSPPAPSPGRPGLCSLAWTEKSDGERKLEARARNGSGRRFGIGELSRGPAGWLLGGTDCRVWQGFKEAAKDQLQSSRRTGVRWMLLKCSFCSVALTTHSWACAMREEPRTLLLPPEISQVYGEGVIFL